MPAYGEPTVTAAGVGQSQTNQADRPRRRARRARRCSGTTTAPLAALGADDDDPGVWLAHGDVADELRPPGRRRAEDRAGADLPRHQPPKLAPDRARPAPTRPRPAPRCRPSSPTLPDSERWFLPHDPAGPKPATPHGDRRAGRTFDRMLAEGAASTRSTSPTCALDPDVDPGRGGRARSTGLQRSATTPSTAALRLYHELVAAPAGLRAQLDVDHRAARRSSIAAEATADSRPRRRCGRTPSAGRGARRAPPGRRLGAARPQPAPRAAARVRPRPAARSSSPCSPRSRCCSRVLLAVPAGIGLAQLGVADGRAADRRPVVPVTQDEVVRAAVAAGGRAAPDRRDRGLCRAGDRSARPDLPARPRPGRRAVGGRRCSWRRSWSASPS